MQTQWHICHPRWRQERRLGRVVNKWLLWGGRDIFFSNEATEGVPMPYKFGPNHASVSNPKVMGSHSQFTGSLDDRETLSQLTKQSSRHTYSWSLLDT